MTISAKANIQISHLPNGIFNAIISPEKISHYFIERASAPITAKSVIFWKFPEFKTELPVTITEIIPNQKTTFTWTPSVPNSKIAIILEPFFETSTVVRIKEKEFKMNKMRYNKRRLGKFLAYLKAFFRIEYQPQKRSF